MVDGKPAKRTGEGAEGRNEGVSEDSDDTVFSGIGMGMGNYYPNTAQHSTAQHPSTLVFVAFSLSRSLVSPNPVSPEYGTGEELNCW